ncbi:group III truncated hemoglobin [Loktanella sp. Alg231-35]|uniref:group III truncated hemoglobin n=1 Tax=Loktanella sp. Alg231-35 TaxID=1922220 RepID=UPI000D554109|nr:group III truncated hemoglobin [Loktanella sp. Alg231-35]
MSLPPRFPITATEIDRVVAAFYALVREHPGLGPVFATHIADWAAHEAKIARFWRNAILFERGYDGNPMQIHLAAGNVRPPQFAIWLDLFDHVLQVELPQETADAWSALAHRIGRGLRFGLENNNTDGPPQLRTA